MIVVLATIPPFVSVTFGMCIMRRLWRRSEGGRMGW